MSNELTDRTIEVEECIRSLGVEPTQDLVSSLAERLETIVFNKERKRRVDGCLKIGGSSVKDWIRCKLAERGEFPISCIDTNMSHVVGTLHFYPWDEEKYGPKPTESCGTAIDMMRSPTMRLVDAKPIDKTAWNVTKTSKH